MSSPKPAPIDILLVEDNPGDVRLTQKAFEKARLNNQLHVVHTGEAALDFLYQRGEYAGGPGADLVLLDLKLPDCTGDELLAKIKADPVLKRTPVVIMTSSEAEEDIARSYDSHANAYITKPVDFPSLIEVVREMGKFWLTLVRYAPRPRNHEDP